MIHTQSTYKIFLVDDDEVFLMILRRHLEMKKKFQIYSFNSGEACVEQLQEQPDIIILDYNLNRSGNLMNGRQVLDEILKQTRRPKIIMLSGQEDGQLVLELLKKGIKEYIVKGTDALEELDGILSEYVSG